MVVKLIREAVIEALELCEADNIEVQVTLNTTGDYTLDFRSDQTAIDMRARLEEYGHDVKHNPMMGGIIFYARLV
jgi:hypothetical protein